MKSKKVYLDGGALVLLVSALLLQETSQAFASVRVSQDHLWVQTKPKELLKASAELWRYLPPPQYAATVYRYCAEQHLAVDIVCRLTWGESKWNPHAFNNSGFSRGLGIDRGLMQLNSRNLKEFAILYNEGKVFEPYDPQANLKVGIRHLGFLVRKYGTLRLAYVAWNAGQSRAYTPPTKTQSYIASLFED